MSLWYAATCGTPKNAWISATLLDVTTGTTTTVLPATCTTQQGWKSATASLIADHTYTLTLVVHTNLAGTRTVSSLFDDVTVS